MSETNNTSGTKHPFRILFFIWLAIELCWSTLIGVVAATGANFLGSAAGASGTAKGVGTVALFIYGFFAGAFQGVVFSFILAIAAVMAIILYGLFTGKLTNGKKGGGSTGGGSDRVGTDTY